MDDTGHDSPFPTTTRGLRRINVDRSNWDSLHHGNCSKLAYSGSLAKLTAHSFASGRVFNKADTEAPDAEQPLLQFEDTDEADSWQRARSIFGIRMLRPDSWVPLTQSFIVAFTDATYTAFIVPLSIAYRADESAWDWIAACDMAAGLVFTVDMLLWLHTGIVVTYNMRGHLIMDGRTVARYYVLHGSFFLDFILALPAWMEAGDMLGVPFLHHSALIRMLLAFRLLRLLRLLRFLKVKFIASLHGQAGRRLIGWLPYSYVYLMNIIYGGAVVINLLGCLWYFTATCEGLENSWLATAGGQDLSSASAVDQYVAAIFFAMTSVLTVGYGDIHPKTTIERGMAMVIMLLGVLFFGFVINALGKMLELSGREARQAANFRDKINAVDSWMTYRQLPRNIRHDVTSYYAEVWAPHADISDETFFAELPAYLKAQIVCYMLREVFEVADIFRVMDHKAKHRLATCLQPVTILPGHDLCQEGDNADRLWIVQEGEVIGLVKGEEIGRLSAPAIIGEEVLLADEVDEARIRSCTFRTVGACTLWELQMRDMGVLQHLSPQTGLDVRNTFHDRLERTHAGAQWRRVLSMGSRPSGELSAAEVASASGLATSLPIDADVPRVSSLPETGKRRVAYSSDLAAGVMLAAAQKRFIHKLKGKVEQRKSEESNAH